MTEDALDGAFLAWEAGRPIRQLAQELGVPRETLRKALRRRKSYVPDAEKEMPPVTALERSVAERGACRGMGELFLIDPWTMTTAAEAQCRKVCESCPVFDDCRRLVERLESNDQEPYHLTGYWAGESVYERARRRRVSAENWRRHAA